MNVTTTAIQNGKILDRYGKHGSHFNGKGMATYSWPFVIENAPSGTVSFAAILYDLDSFPVSGFVWIHWTIANLHRTEVQENESQTATDFVQGVNSDMRAIGKDLSSFYGGMAPPDRPHQYTLHVFALDTELQLQHGFMLNDMLRQMEGHVLADAKVSGLYDN